MKSRLRLIATQALCDASLSNEYLLGFHLPSIEEYIGKAYVFGAGKNVFKYAKSMLLNFSDAENNFWNYGTGTQKIGLECITSHGTWIFTKIGWIPKEN